MNNKAILTTAVALMLCIGARADEGMWMVNAISKALVEKMQKSGLQLAADEIYSVDQVSLSDAIVSLDFACTGSMVSDKGLLITNHHCAYGDVFRLSTAEHNYLEDGYWARNASEEIPIPGKSVQFLQKILDVTDEVNGLIEEERLNGKPTGMRHISYVIESRYNKATGLEASLSSMWAGSKYYLALYKVYTDVRLVAAPPVSIAAFGGDIDNWEWPQHKCDFALYRIYSAPDGSPAPYSKDNVPMHPRRRLKISTDGYKPGDFTLILGYPGRTDRYSSSAKVNYMTTLSLPISNKIRADQMAIIKGWMDKDPEVRLMYSDRFFSLSNVQENQEGEVQCCERFKVVHNKQKIESKLAKDSKELLNELDEGYTAIRDAEADLIYFRESIIRGCRLNLVASRLKNMRKGPIDMEKEYKGMDLRVEKDLLRYGIESFYENVSPEMWGPYQKEVYSKYGKDYDAMLAFLWKDDYMTKDDPIYKFMTDVTVAPYNKAIDKVLGDRNVATLNKEYTKALYNWREEHNVLQYPDANSSMRLSYGTVGTFKRDGKKLPWQTWSTEILAKENDSYDFSLKADWRAMLQGSMVPVDFISDNDITGGNSGSPVMNAKGELIGLAFDGNKESLASDVMWTPKYNKCVNVDIRFVLWTLSNYAKLDYIVDEMMN